VFWYVDPSTDVPRLREKLAEVVKANPRWDGRFFNLQVTDVKTDAVLVNPYSPEEMADAIARALKMPLAERKARWEKLIDNVRREDVMWWCELFITALEDAPEHAEA
jgi:trehalose-6-phosphate synthase